MKTTSISILIAIVFIGGAFLLTRNFRNTGQEININNVSIVDGKQIIEINTKGGYSPETSTAQANMPTILRFKTSGTFDCSSSIRIPSMNITKLLPNSGTTDIDLGNPKSGTLQGTCGMGMYPFNIVFQS